MEDKMRRPVTNLVGSPGERERIRRQAVPVEVIPENS